MNALIALLEELFTTIFGGAIATATGINSSNEASVTDWNRYDDLFKTYGAMYDVDWRILKAIALNESSLGQNPSVARGIANPSDIQGSISSDGKSWGLMQVTLKTAQSIDSDAMPEKLNDPEYSISIASQYLQNLQGQYSTLDPRYLEWIVKSYNEGPGNVRKEQASGVGFSDEYWSRFQRNLTKVKAG